MRIKNTFDFLVKLYTWNLSFLPHTLKQYSNNKWDRASVPFGPNRLCIVDNTSRKQRILISRWMMYLMIISCYRP